jgi:hypothetical protein
LRRILNEVANSKDVYVLRPDTVADLNLPPAHKRALQEAIGQVSSTRGEARNREADRLSLELFESLPADHETKEERLERRASEGDAEAISAISVRDQAVEDMADRIYKKAHGVL